MTASSRHLAAAFIAFALPAFAADLPKVAKVEGVAYPTYMIPNIPEAAEVYYATDNRHMIGQTRDPAAVKSGYGGEGALTYIFTDDGKEIRRINDHGQDACSHWFPDMKHVVWTSTRDHMDMPVGNWSDPDHYPQGAELYMSDVKGGNVKRLTNNQHYDAEVSVSPDGKWIVFGREIDGKNDLWVMKSDGTGEHQITHTADWQEGHPFFLPDNERIMFRAWRKSEIGKIKPTPMTIFTVKKDGTDMRAHTFDHDMNWAPYPAPDGHRFIFVRIVENNNWEVFIGDMAAPRGTAPVRLTFNDGFDGLPNISPNGRKVSFARSTKPGFMAGIRTFIMDVSPLKMGPENYVKFDPKWGEPVSGE